MYFCYILKHLNLLCLGLRILYVLNLLVECFEKLVFLQPLMQDCENLYIKRFRLLFNFWMTKRSLFVHNFESQLKVWYIDLWRGFWYWFLLLFFNFSLMLWKPELKELSILLWSLVWHIAWLWIKSLKFLVLCPSITFSNTHLLWFKPVFGAVCSSA